MLVNFAYLALGNVLSFVLKFLEMYFPKIKEASDNVDPSIKRAMIFATLVVIVLDSP